MTPRGWPEDPAACKDYRREFGVRTDRQIQRAERKRLKREAVNATKPSTRNHQREG